VVAKTADRQGKWSTSASAPAELAAAARSRVNTPSGAEAFKKSYYNRHG